MTKHFPHSLQRDKFELLRAAGITVKILFKDDLLKLGVVL